MKKTIISCGLIAFAALTMFSCKKSSDTVSNADPLAADRAAVRAMSFDASDLKKVDGGYIVERDIFLSDENVRAGANLAGVPSEEQWRTFNLVSLPPAPGTRTITIALATNLNTTFWRNVLAGAAARYNNLGLRLRFSVLNPGSAANIVVTAIPGSGAVAGFPTGGNPFNLIQMGTGIEACSGGTATTVMAHEMGHCIGFRHTDWYNRSFSCGAGGSEGQQFDGVGAVLIPGTPSAIVAGSWMLACYNCGGDRQFVASDVTALRALYQ
jgi:hypothetical protein